MAKVGEGDPRWLVKNREDGKNVNNWHWSEKDLFSWAKDKLFTLFTDFVIIDNDTMNVVIPKVDEMKGSVTINNRKGKKIFIWDFNMTLLWNGTIKESEEKGKGKIECVDINVTDENFDLYVTQEKETSKNIGLRQALKESALKAIKEKVKVMTDELKTTFGEMQNFEDQENKVDNVVVEKTKKENLSKVLTTSDGKKLDVSNFLVEVRFNAPPKLLYETFTDANKVSGFTGSQAKLSNEVGSEFELFGGSVKGIQEELEEGKRIVQKWRFTSWPEGHYSIVEMNFKEDGSKCILTLSQKEVPSFDLERTKQGWESFFWSRISAIFGWRYKILK